LDTKIAIAVTMALIFVTSGLTGCITNSSPNKSGPIYVTDLAGRNVTLEKPANRTIIALGQDIFNYAAIYGPGFMKTLVGMGGDLKADNNDMYTQYQAKFPEIDNIPDIMPKSTGVFDTEKVLSLRPDLVIIGISSKAKLKDNDVPLLEQAGIAVIFWDFNTEVLKNTTASITMLGKLVGKEKRAQELATLYTKEVDKVYSRLANLTVNKPLVYLEYVALGPAVYGKTSSKTFMWGSMVNKAGGNNIANDLTGNGYIQINPEYLFEKDPAMIMFTSVYGLAGRPLALPMGYHANYNDSYKEILKYLERPGWSNLTAVKNRKVYAICHAAARNVADFVALQYFAKMFYPDEFKDLTPEQGLKDFHEKYLPVDYTGVWFLSVNG
jgi:iron complex transport system substrate-binding protein